MPLRPSSLRQPHIYPCLKHDDIAPSVNEQLPVPSLLIPSQHTGSYVSNGTVSHTQPVLHCTNMAIIVTVVATETLQPAQL